MHCSWELKKIYFIDSWWLKYYFILSLTRCLSLSESLHLKLSSFPKTLSSSRPLSITLLSHRHSLKLSFTATGPTQPSQAALKTHRHSPLSPSLSQAPSFTVVGLTKPPIALVPSRRLPLCLIGGSGGCVGRLASVGSLALVGCGWVR